MTAANSKLLPQFVLISISSFFGLFSEVAPADLNHINDGGSIKDLPSLKRQ